MHSVEPRTRITFIEAARRRQITEAAIETIAELGAPSATFAAIAARADISPALISYHFASRHGLLTSVALELDAHLRAAMDDAASDAASHLDAARRIVVGFVEYVGAHRTRMVAIRELAAALPRDERVQVAVLDDQRGIAAWAVLVRDGRTAGEFRDIEPHLAGALVMGMLSAVPGQLYARNPIAPSHLATELADAIERLLRR